MTFGLPGVPLTAGDHICALYAGAYERDGVLAPYLEAGLVAGDKCVCVIEAEDQQRLLAEVADTADVEACITSGQLELFTSAESYLRSGTFSVDGMVDFWTQSNDDALTSGRFDFARNAGDTTGLAEIAADFDDFAAYEAEINRISLRHPQSFLCLYDVRLFDGEVILELLRTHPKLLRGRMVIDNPHYLTPEEYLALRQRTGTVWTMLTAEERTVAGLVGYGLTNEEIADRLALSRPLVDRHLHRIARKLGVTSRTDVARMVRERT
ncbi:MAG: protein kinase family protein [Acidimicrobiales bacterium]|jgi:DNA-binding CsgD family transcriptional regulator|nr:protein kinase family protein [Acidimicrobiales bacterium]